MGRVDLSAAAVRKRIDRLIDSIDTQPQAAAGRWRFRAQLFFSSSCAAVSALCAATRVGVGDTGVLMHSCLPLVAYSSSP